MQSYSTSHPIIFNMKLSATGTSLRLEGLTVHGRVLGPSHQDPGISGLSYTLTLSTNITHDITLRQYSKRERGWPANVHCLKQGFSTGFVPGTTILTRK